MSEQLKPCPFCGGEAKIETSFHGSCCWVKCTSCNAETDENPDDRSATGAALFWNNRKCDTCLDTLEQIDGKKES